MTLSSKQSYILSIGRYPEVENNVDKHRDLFVLCSENVVMSTKDYQRRKLKFNLRNFSLTVFAGPQILNMCLYI